MIEQRGVSGQIAELQQLMEDILQTLEELLEQGESRYGAAAAGGIGSSAGGSFGSSAKKRADGYAGSPGFLWKPVSESDGKLVVLLPQKFTGKVSSVRVLAPDGRTVLEEGKSRGVGNGNREHFRFSRPGASFPPGSIVSITDRAGQVTTVKIDKTAGRIEGR